MVTKEIRSNNKACDKTIPLTSKKPIFYHYSGMKFYTCPSNFNQDSYAYWITISRRYEEGNGSFDLDEPNKNVEALEFVDSLRLDYANKKMREVNGK